MARWRRAITRSSLTPLTAGMQATTRLLAGNGALPLTKWLDRSDWDGSLSSGNINTEAPDFSLTNETYWTHVDAILTYAGSKGLLCFMFSAYS